MIKPMLVCSAFYLLPNTAALSLPIGFGVNQGDHEYSELKSEHFYIYHDKRTPEEARMVLNSLEAARPVFQKWFGIEREKVLPVITSAISSNASFANVITDAIELQTRGQGDRDLTWHEYTHTTMYGRLANFFGPPGTLIHLFFMPAWFLEGLAETMSMSVGTDRTSGIERYQALSDDWPTYERLHSLYTSSFSTRGYATAGAFTSWVLRQGNPNDLPKLLDDFWDYTMPQWWVWSAVPFNGFLPMDAALEAYTGKTGEQLWESYKDAAKEHWNNAGKGPFYAGEVVKRRSFTGFSDLETQGNKTLMTLDIEDELWQVEVLFDPLTDWATKYRKIRRYPKGWGKVSEDLQGNLTSEIHQLSKSSKKQLKSKLVLKRPGIATEMIPTKDGFVWSETDLSESRICLKKKSKTAKVRCPVKMRLPTTLRLLTVSKYADGRAKMLWFDKRVQTMLGDRHQLFAFDPHSETPAKLSVDDIGPIQSASLSGDHLWVLAREKNERTIRKLDFSGKCLQVYHFKDHIQTARVTSQGTLVLGLYGGDHRYLKKVDPKSLKPKPCYAPPAHTSPLLYAMQQDNEDLDFRSALYATDPWKPTKPSRVTIETRKRHASKSLDQATPEGINMDEASTPANWRGRPVLLFPWLGADDALGSQVGIVTVPLMDHMQNESIRLTLMYGLASKFPHQELSITSGRFKADVQLTLFRHQTWNGLLLDRLTGEAKNTYYDERGGRLELNRTFRVGSSLLNLGTGVKHSHLSPYLGILRIPRGFRTEWSGSASVRSRVAGLNWSNRLSTRLTRENWNENFDYDQISMGTSFSRGLFWASRLSLGLEGSRTRGKKPMALQEIYRPLKTFVPGSGGGINQTSFAITADQGLFSAIYGNTQARSKASWTLPLVPNFDALWYVIYVERLDFTAFYNYGGAWRGDKPSAGWDKLIRSHGYNLDLQFDNKGVRFNTGMGVGQVIGRDFQLYATFGFDALF